MRRLPRIEHFSPLRVLRETEKTSIEKDSTMDLNREKQLLLTRRQFFGRSAAGIGTAALASLLSPSVFSGNSAAAASVPAATPGYHGILKALHFAPKAKRVIYLFMSGGPSHIDLFDYKP